MTAVTSDERPASGSPRLKAVAISILMFAIYFALLQAIVQFGKPYFQHLAAPAGAPALWWRVVLSVALVGSADVIAAVVPVFLYCLVRRRSFADLGFSRRGTVLAWILVLAGQAGLIWFDTHLGAVGRAPGALGTYALLASAIVGPCAALAEETFFRGFLMEELRRGSFGVTLQCLISGLFFGLAHLSYLSGPAGWTIPVFTGVLGIFWSFVYVIGKRSLWPTMVAHAINDAVLIPSVFYLIGMHVGH